MLKLPLGVLSLGEYMRFKYGRPLPKTPAAFREALPQLRRAFRRYLFSGQLPELVLNETIPTGEYMAAVADRLINFDIPYFYARGNWRIPADSGRNRLLCALHQQLFLSLAINGFDGSYFNDSRVLGHYAENYAYLRLRTIEGEPVEYYRDPTGEIDFVGPKNVWEVKFGAVGDASGYERLAGRLGKKLIMLTENEMETTDTFTKLPLYLL